MSPSLGRSRCAVPVRLVLAFAATALAGCALEPFPDESLPRRAAVAVGAASPTQDGAAFVRESRDPGGPQYLPVGVTPPARPARARTPEEAKALEGELDAARNASAAAARRPVPPSTYGTPAAPVLPPAPARSELVAPGESAPASR